MSRFFTEIGNKVSDDWKFAIKNALLLVVFPLFIILIIILISVLISTILAPTGIDALMVIHTFLAYLSGFFVYIAVIFRIILNFINYYKEK